MNSIFIFQVLMFELWVEDRDKRSPFSLDQSDALQARICPVVARS